MTEIWLVSGFGANGLVGFQVISTSTLVFQPEETLEGDEWR